MPKVSIILTSFNHRKYLIEAIDSALNQTFTDFELIIWDDASSDGSWELIKNYSDVRIKAFCNEVRRRGVWGINKAISEIAQGEYIAIHHSDDIWERDKLAKQVAFLDVNPGYGAVFTSVKPIDDSGNEFSDESHSYANIFNQPNRSRFEWLNFFFFHDNALCHPSALVRKSAYLKCGLYRYGLAQLADLDMWVRICLEYEIYVLPLKLTCFRIRDSEANASGNTLQSRIRIAVEKHVLFWNYLKLTKQEEVEAIFPKAEALRVSQGFVAEFEIAMSTFAREDNFSAQLAAIDILFQLLNDPVKSKEINRVYGFGYVNYIELYGGMDVLAVEAREVMLEGNIAIKERDEILRSTSWRITSPLRKLSDILHKLIV